MIVAACELRFRIGHARSLKEKRQAARHLIDRVKGRFNVAIAEVDLQDRHQDLVLGVALVSNALHHAEESLERVIRHLDADGAAELVGVDRRFY